MTRNNPKRDALTRDDECIARAQNRLKKAYLRHVSWRGVAAEFGGYNVRYVWALVQRGEVPRAPEIRAALGLPRVMPSERKRRPKPAKVRIGEPGWEAIYFRKYGKSK